MNQYALGNKLLKNSRKVKPDMIRTAFLFGLELEMQVELLKRNNNDEIDTLEQCIAAALEIHGEPHVPTQVVQNFYGYGGGWILRRLWLERELVGVRPDGGHQWIWMC